MGEAKKRGSYDERRAAALAVADSARKLDAMVVQRRGKSRFGPILAAALAAGSVSVTAEAVLTGDCDD